MKESEEERGRVRGGNGKVTCNGLTETPMYWFYGKRRRNLKETKKMNVKWNGMELLQKWICLHIC